MREATWLGMFLSVAMIIAVAFYLNDVGITLLPETTGLFNRFIALWPLWAGLTAALILISWVASSKRR